MIAAAAAAVATNSPRFEQNKLGKKLPYANKNGPTTMKTDTQTSLTTTTTTTTTMSHKSGTTSVQKPVKLRNLLNGERTVDNLHIKYKNNNKSHACNETRCLGSLINASPVEARVRSSQETWEQARDFIDGYYASIKRVDTQAHKSRLKDIEEQIKSTDTYYLKETELIYGAKLAWRNAPRCIGRIQWSKLQVFDARFTRNAAEMFEAICNHIKYATNKGSLRSAITIFPQRVKSIKNDWRIWNSQLIGYAGYRDKETGKIRGDPINADLTEICQRLGWQGKGGEFDILPLVLSANGGPPEMFPLPEELVLRVKLKHPKFDWFQELGLEWYALPAVSSMMLDVGGLQFTACPFSGWYMVTEIGTRDLADTNRYNKLELVAQRMGLNTRTNMSLWKDLAANELNLAVLDSFQRAGVTIVDHHTASETFMTHLANEQRLRGGCPADWVWLVPPTAGSLTPVFHQEMVNYHLLPNYEYLEQPWKNFDWSLWEKQEEERRTNQELLRRKKLAAAAEKKAASIMSPQSKNGPTSPPSSANGKSPSNPESTPRHLRFKEIARAVKFTSKLFGKALSRRIKATILYATETGRSERFANKLAQTFSHAFNVHLMSMSDYDMACLEHEALLLIVTSTFGNGDPPENGELFAKHLAAIKLTGDTSPDIESINSVSTNPFFQMLSEDHKDGKDAATGGLSNNLEACTTSNNNTSAEPAHSENSDSPSNGPVGEASQQQQGLLAAARRRTSEADYQSSLLQSQQHQTANVRPLSNVRFAVFALGSTAYPHFCAYGRYVDQTLGELGAERILKCACGDELCGQEKAFNEWSAQVFRVACDVFCLTDQLEPGIEGGTETVWSPADVKFVPADLEPDSYEQQVLDPPSSIPPRDKTTMPEANQQKQANSVNSKHTIVQNLKSIVGKKIIPFTVRNRIDLHRYVKEENLQTICVDLDSGVRTVKFQPGDHIGIYPENKRETVQKILDRIRRDFGQLNGSENGHDGEIRGAKIANSTTKSIGDKNGHHYVMDFDRRLAVLVKRSNMDPMTQGDDWVPCDTIPITSLREALTRYLDITNPPNQEFLLILSRLTSDQDEKKRLQQMARNFTVYEEWKNQKVPTLLSLLDEFKSAKFDPTLITQIPPMKPRFYSISGLSLSLTLGVVRYYTNSGEFREGLCSNYLNDIKVDPRCFVYGYVRSAPAFHMPQDKSIPMILISAGTGIAPFRAFWKRRYTDIYGETGSSFKTASMAMNELTTNAINNNNNNIDSDIANCTQSDLDQKFPKNLNLFGPINMYFGCRNANYILYRYELEEMKKSGVLSSVNIAFSRPLTTLEKEPNFKKMYVQDKLLENGAHVFKSISEGAHIYVCGDVAMADGVYKTLAIIINRNLQKEKESPQVEAPKFTLGEDGDSALMNLRNHNRYHEDIFGARR